MAKFSYAQLSPDSYKTVFDKAWFNKDSLDKLNSEISDFFDPNLREPFPVLRELQTSIHKTLKSEYFPEEDRANPGVEGIGTKLRKMQRREESN